MAISASLNETGETAELTIYRIVQEALTNVFRHADASRVEVTVEPAPGQGRCVLVRVSDDGGGLPPDHRLGLGLTGMRERVLALGGAVTVASTDSGVTVEAIVPCSHRDAVREFFPKV
jgi:two-component system sensor histidine kinase UhpB